MRLLREAAADVSKEISGSAHARSQVHPMCSWRCHGANLFLAGAA